MSDDDGYICGFHIKTDGTTKVASMEDAGATSANDEWTWLHFDVNGSRTHDWLKSELGLDDALIEALTAEGSRPRTTVMTSGTLIILRGVNLHPESDPTDMISVRLWVEPGRIVSSRFRRLLSMQELLRRCEANAAPANVGQFVVDLNLGLIERMSGVIQELDAEIDALEEGNVIESVSDFRQRLVSVRQKIIPLRRFISPQRDALSQMLSARVDWLDEWQRGQIREAADRLTRYVEELDAMREKGSIIQDTVATLMSEQMNRTMLVLSIVAAIFLPLGLLTGLLGINVGGIPGTEWKGSFWVVVALMGALTVFEIWLFRRLGLIHSPRKQK
jgi:zinc transporter